MALLFTSNYQMTLGQTDLDAVTLNAIWQSMDNRLDFLELNNALSFYVPGVLAVGNILRFPWPFRAQNVSMGLAVNTAPTDADLICQLEVGGTDVFKAANRPKIADGDLFGTYSVNGVNLASFSEDDQAIIQVDQIGSTIAGSDLAVIIRGEKTLL